MRFRSAFYLLLACACVLHAWAAAAENPPKLAELPEVKTWGELLDLPAVDAGGGRHVRLGIGARRAPAGSAVMVYALVDGPPDPEYKPTKFKDAEPLGYFSVKTEPAEEGRLKRAMNTNDVMAQRDTTAGARLFAMPVRTPKKGSVTVSVLDSKGQPLAAAELAASDAPVHPWLPMRMDTDEANTVESLERNIKVELVPNNYELEAVWPDHESFPAPKSESGAFAEAGALLPCIEPRDRLAEGASLPEPSEQTRAEIAQAIKDLSSDEYEVRQAAFSRMRKLGVAAAGTMQKAKKEATDPELRMQLERLLAALGPGFRIEQNKSHLHVTLPAGLAVNMPYDNFLVRLWINGKPFAPESEKDERNRTNVQSMRTLRNFDFVLQMDLKKFGIQPRDRVELQMLCTPHGIFSKRCEVLEGFMGSPPKIRWPLLSNRIEWQAQ